MSDVRIVDAGVNFAKGYAVVSTRAGIKASSQKEDMAMIVSQQAATYVGTFTRNLVKAAPVQYDQKKMEDRMLTQAVVINTGIANAVTGAPGLKVCEDTAEAMEEVLSLDKDKMLVASTGVIGMQIPEDILFAGIKDMGAKLKDSDFDLEDAAKRKLANDAAIAIMTTDTKPKEVAVEFEIGGDTVKIGAMCKGSGMIHPNMGTMLGFLMSDISIDHDYALATLRKVVEKTFNMVSVDGDTSTNDTIIFMGNGMAQNSMLSNGSSEEDKATFEEALTIICESLAKQIAKDGEGATRLFTAIVKGAKDYDTAKTLAKSVITSNLTKAAIFGKDANWGRIFCAMGYSGADFDPNTTDITMSSAKGSIQLVVDGLATNFSEEEALNILDSDEVTAICDCKQGDATAVAWGCDLTYDYVTINADYRS